MKIFMRAPRGWIFYLASTLGFDTIDENKKMFEKPKGVRGKIIFSILNILKKSRLPPIEWFVSYDKHYKIDGSVHFIIEPASKLINTNKDYMVYIENGLGLFAFNTRKINKANIFIFRRKITSRNLKGFIFYSYAALNSTRSLFKKIDCIEDFNRLNRGVIYPITRDVFSDRGNLIKKNKRILFCSSSFNLKGGRELLKAFLLCKSFNSCELILVTPKNKMLTDIEASHSNIVVHDFNLSSDEYIELIKSVDMIVHPTFFDTHALALLEAIKSSIPAISTRTFALSEYIEDKKTGILIDNPYSPYLEDGSPGFMGAALSYAKLIEGKPENKAFVNSLVESIDCIIENYDFFKKNCLISSGEQSLFSESKIKRQWTDLMKAERILK